MKHSKDPIVGLALVALAFPAIAQVDLTPYLKKDVYGDIKISPTGEYYAVTVPTADRTMLAVIRRSDKAFTARVSGPQKSDIADFHWVNDQRIVVSMAERLSTLESPVPTGELHAINADGKLARTLMSHYERDTGISATQTFGDFYAGFLEDDLPAEDDSVLISVQAFTADPTTRIDRMHVVTGRRVTVATAPVRRARFTTDGHGEVRFARGAGSDNVSKLYYRDARGADWRLINDEATSHRVELALGFAPDNRTAYLQVEQSQGPDAIVALDTTTGQRSDVLRDAVVDPHSIIHDATGSPVGATYMKERLVSRYFDETSPPARAQRMLEKAFPGMSVRVVSSTRDSRLSLILVASDRSPGDFYLFDNTTREASLVFSRADWFDPAQSAQVRPIALTARDGLPLHGYLTVPPGSDGKRLPLVVLPHGGPFGFYDEWGFDRDTQMLAAAGYAVLQINYRGSGNYGRTFLHAGAREWGGAMQDDLTDATRWAVEQGVTEAGRICIYGASYGGYAALMGAAKEPDLYRCAVGYVGVYDLQMRRDDLGDSARWLGTFANEWMGDDDATLAQRSPNRIAERIKVPVFLAAGGKDSTAPIAHSQKMEKALRAAGTPVETLYFPTEGHGFHTEEHQREYYTRLLEFLSRHLGGQKAG